MRIAEGLEQWICAGKVCGIIVMINEDLMNFNEILWHSVFRLQISACPKASMPIAPNLQNGSTTKKSVSHICSGWMTSMKDADGSGFSFRLWNVSNLASLKGDEGVVDTSAEYTSSRKIWQKHPRFKDWSKGLKRLKSDAVSLIISRPPSVVSYL